MYDFTNIIDRHKTNSTKWREADIIPLWIADMDFSFPEVVKKSLLSLIEEGVLGYAYLPDTCYHSVVNFYNKNYSTKLEAGNVIFTTGVIASLGAALNTFCQPGEEVLFLTPCYNTFYSVVEKMGLKVITSELDYNDGQYNINYKDFAQKLSRPNLRAFVLCNPHNPTGHIWSIEDLKKINTLCRERNILVIADEIHGPITLPNLKYECSLNYIENVIVLASPSKPFNMAGLKIGFSLCYNKNINARLSLAYNRFNIASPNSFAIQLLPTLYNDCQDWLIELSQAIKHNYELTLKYIESNGLKIKVSYGGGTYLLWLDVSYYSNDSLKLSKFLKEKYKVFVSEGSKYLGNGHNFLRVNIATNEKTLLMGLERIKNGLLAYKNYKS